MNDKKTSVFIVLGTLLFFTPKVFSMEPDIPMNLSKKVRAIMLDGAKFGEKKTKRSNYTSQYSPARLKEYKKRRQYGVLDHPESIKPIIKKESSKGAKKNWNRICSSALQTIGEQKNLLEQQQHKSPDHKNAFDALCYMYTQLDNAQQCETALVKDIFLAESWNTRAGCMDYEKDLVTRDNKQVGSFHYDFVAIECLYKKRNLSYTDYRHTKFKRPSIYKFPPIKEENRSFNTKDAYALTPIQQKLFGSYHHYLIPEFVQLLPDDKTISLTSPQDLNEFSTLCNKASHIICQRKKS